MDKAVAFLKSRKVDGSEWQYDEKYLLQTLKFIPSAKVSLKNVEKIAEDFALHMGATGPATVTPIFEEGKIQLTWLKDSITSQYLPIHPIPYSLPLGILADGRHKSLSLPKSPHIIVAGTTGSGKSYWMHTAIRWAISQGIHVFGIDPKFGEFAEYKREERFYHLPDGQIYNDVLDELIDTMNSNYEQMAAAKVKNIQDWEYSPSPHLLIIDELADIVLTHGKDFLKKLQLLAQKGRAAGFHIIAATQSPTAKLLSGELKANFPVRIAFKTANATASKIILDIAGAEKLAGAGDGLCIAEDGNLIRFKGYKLSSSQIISSHWRN